ncbi:hypothetical protein BC829DRAFT_20185 [Chytridium lagenaria]|nr:hypothetical protein BC829DRAFT_20185 [Chytridium lagenaria]
MVIDIGRTSPTKSLQSPQEMSPLSPAPFTVRPDSSVQETPSDSDCNAVASSLSIRLGLPGGMEFSQISVASLYRKAVFKGDEENSLTPQVDASAVTIVKTDLMDDIEGVRRKLWKRGENEWLKDMTVAQPCEDDGEWSSSTLVWKDTEGYKAQSVAVKGEKICHRRKRILSGDKMVREAGQSSSTCLNWRESVVEDEEDGEATKGSRKRRVMGALPECSLTSPMASHLRLKEKVRDDGNRSAKWRRCRCHGCLMLDSDSSDSDE